MEKPDYYSTKVGQVDAQIQKQMELYLSGHITLYEFEAAFKQLMIDIRKAHITQDKLN